MFTFGIGSGVSTELIKGIARAGNGRAEFVYEGERMQPKVHYVATLHIHTFTYKFQFVLLSNIYYEVCKFFIGSSFSPMIR